jgi:hypothetical protein
MHGPAVPLPIIRPAELFWFTREKLVGCLASRAITDEAKAHFRGWRARDYDATPPAPNGRRLEINEGAKQ